MKALSREEFEALIAVAKKYNERDALMYMLMMQHSMRVTEVVGGWAKSKNGEKYWHEGITAKSIINDSFLVVPRLKRSRNIEHPLLPNEKEALLKLAKEVPEGRLFPMCRKTSWLKIKKYGVEAGIPWNRIFNHCLKHTSGRLGYKGGATVQEIVQRMGHVNPANSLLYSQATMEEANEAFGKVFGV